jgi:hypothetical protein
MVMVFGGLVNIHNIYFFNMSNSLLKDIKTIQELLVWICEIKSENHMEFIPHGEMATLLVIGEWQHKNQLISHYVLPHTG